MDSEPTMAEALRAPLKLEITGPRSWFKILQLAAIIGCRVHCTARFAKWDLASGFCPASPLRPAGSTMPRSVGARPVGY